MTCNFCKWDTLFDAQQQEDHARSCEEKKRATGLDDERWTKLTCMLHDPELVPGCSVDEIIFELLTFFETIQTDRWYRLKLMRN